MNNRPIGVFDSGLGGLSVWREIKKLLPGESLVYFGDGKNCPYGYRSAGKVREFVLQGVERLLEHDIKMLVIACNAATAAAAEHLRAKYPFPVVGMEPAVKPAALSSKSGVIGILATAATLRGDIYRATAARYAGCVEILSAVGKGFVELVESGDVESPKAVETVRRQLEPMLLLGADRIVLGCTHYPFLEGAIKMVVGSRDVRIINPAQAVARHVGSLLKEHGITAEPDHGARYEFQTAGDEEYLQKIANLAR